MRAIVTVVKFPPCYPGLAWRQTERQTDSRETDLVHQIERDRLTRREVDLVHQIERDRLTHRGGPGPPDRETDLV